MGVTVGAIGLGRIGAFHTYTLSALSGVDGVVGWEEQVPVRNLETGATSPNGTPHSSFMDRFASAYQVELAAFVDVIAGRIESPCTARDALEVAYIAEAATLSLQQHRPVRIDEVRL